MTTILLVEDDDLVAESMSDILSSAGGYTVLRAANGHLGLRMLEANDVALVITDILMPDEDGMGFLLKKRAIKPLVPTIAMSGGSPSMPGLDLPKMAHLLGADIGLPKPIEPGVLLDHVARLIAIGVANPLPPLA